MRIAVCVKSSEERTTLVKWLEQYCLLYGISCCVTSFGGGEEFFDRTQAGQFELVFAGLGGTEGLLMARRLREMDKKCAIVIIDDTTQNAVAGVRLHASDYIVRPVQFKRLVSAMKLVLTGMES